MKNLLSLVIFRQINYLANFSLMKIAFTIFCQKSMRVNFRNYLPYYIVLRLR